MGLKMNRDEWKFEYAATQLAEAAQAKARLHQERLSWWKGQKDQVMDTIRAEGLEIDEKVVGQQSVMKGRDWQDATRVTVRNDLRQQLDECLKKLSYHTEKLHSFRGWIEILEANTQSRLALDHEDWRFFFGVEA